MEAGIAMWGGAVGISASTAMGVGLVQALHRSPSSVRPHAPRASHGRQSTKAVLEFLGFPRISKFFLIFNWDFDFDLIWLDLI